MAEKTWLPSGNMREMDSSQLSLLGAIIGLARVCDTNEETVDTNAFLVDALMSLNRKSDRKAEAAELREKLNEEKFKIVPDCRYCANPCGRTSDYDVRMLRFAEKETVYLKETLTDMIIDNAPIFHKLLVPGIGADEIFKELKYLIFVIGEDFTDGGIYDAIERCAKLKIKAEEKMTEFYSKY